MSLSDYLKANNVVAIAGIDTRRLTRILVCGLNPHAGEGGHLGHEEIDIIEPTLERLRLEGMDLRGPLPADTLFTPKYLCAGLVCMAVSMSSTSRGNRGRFVAAAPPPPPPPYVHDRHAFDSRR